MESTTNPVIAALLEKQQAQFAFLKAAKILGLTEQAAYSSRSRGTFPIKTRQVGKRLVVFTSDLISYLQTGESQSSSSVPQIARQFKVRTGRPTRREQLTAEKMGLTVKQLRASGSEAVVVALEVL